MSEFLVYDSDGELCCTLRAPDRATALRLAAVEVGDPEADVAPVTPEVRRDWRNARRRERYAERKAEIPEDRCVLPSEDAAALALIPMMAWLSLSDEQTGRPRCPTCGRYRRWRDFVGAPSSTRISSGVVDFAPSCRACRERRAGERILAGVGE